LSGYTCNGSCGTDGADGDVPLSPTGNSVYSWVSTNGGISGVGALPSGAVGLETDGSTLATPVFSATAGTALNFYFDYVTSDGSSTYSDYAWAELFTSTGPPVALIFTAQTEPSGSIIPAAGLPLPSAGTTLTPNSVPITPNATNWSPLGGSSGSCFAAGCGNTGWVLSNYTIATAGNYYLEVGTVNWADTLYDTGLALDGVTVGGVPVGPTSGTPEPSSVMLLASGLAALTGVAWKRRRAQQ
jgi:hypothetical protein